MNAINRTPGVCGGRACIRNTRIAVWTIQAWSSLGMKVEDFPETFDGLTLGDIKAAFAYIDANKAEIDADIAENT